MIEEKILKHLRDALTVPVYMEKPEKEPDEYVILENTGGSESNHIRIATIAVRSIAKKMYRAAELGEEAKHAMETLIEDPYVSACRVNTAPMNYTNTTTQQYRYQGVYIVTYMEE